MQMLTDNAVRKCGDDCFGFAEYASILARSILDTPDLPFCLGVFGPWGCGKTSLMYMIEQQIKERDAAQTIWFNPWRYDKKEAVWSALLQALLYEMAERTKDGNQTLSKKAKELAAWTAWILLKKGASLATSGVVDGEAMESLKKRFLEEDELYHRYINHFEEDFRQIVSEFTRDSRLVIFIDDLDRCLPENVVMILESLKLFVGSSNCVFVIGMDPCVVELGITSRYGANLRLSGRDYLDKMVQVAFFVPPAPFHKLRDAMRVTKTADYDDAIWYLLEHGLGGNPRKMKRFVNCFWFLQKITEDQVLQREQYPWAQNPPRALGLQRNTQRFYLAKLMVFRLAFSDFYSYLEHHPDAWSTFESLFSADPREQRPEILRNNAGLTKFWEDDLFRTFMRRTSGDEGLLNLGPAPGADIVGLLMKAISLVAAGGGNSRSSSDASSSLSFSSESVSPSSSSSYGA